MMKQPVLSIIIPTYNRSNKTLRAMKSIAAAVGRHPCEIIVVDDGSQVAFSGPAFNSKLLELKTLRFQYNKGASAARNAGIEAARAPLISFLDSDDQLRPSSLDARIDYAINRGCLNQEGIFKLTACSWTDVDAEGKVLRNRQPYATKCAEDFLRGCWFSPGSCIIANRELFKDPDMRFDPSLRRLEDFDLFAKLALKKEANLSVSPVIGAQIERSTGRSSQAVFDACSAIRERMNGYEKSGKISRNSRRKAFAYLSYESAKFHFQNGELSKCLMTLTASFVLSPRTKMYPGPGWKIEQV